MIRQGATAHRGPRRKVLLRARMRAGGPKVDICIRDLSTRGMLVQSAAPPPRGTYVEIVCDGLPIVGKVVWSGDRRFGVATRDAMDVDVVVAELGGGAMVRTSAAALKAGAKSKAVSRSTGTALVVRTSDQSQAWGRAMQFAGVAAASGAAAFGIAYTLHDRLSGVFGIVADTL